MIRARAPRGLAAILLWFTFGLSLPFVSQAIDTERAFDDPQLQARYEQLTREFRCLTCRSQTVADSNAPLASDLRREVRELMAKGKSDDEIRDFMLARYGDFVLYRPRFTPLTLLLWIAPALLLAVGLLLAWRVIRGRGVTQDEESDSIDGDRP